MYTQFCRFVLIVWTSYDIQHHSYPYQVKPITIISSLFTYIDSQYKWNVLGVFFYYPAGIRDIPIDAVDSTVRVHTIRIVVAADDVRRVNLNILDSINYLGYILELVQRLELRTSKLQISCSTD